MSLTPAQILHCFYNIDSGNQAPSVLITTDSTQHTIDTTTLYTIDNNNTTT